MGRMIERNVGKKAGRIDLKKPWRTLFGIHEPDGHFASHGGGVIIRRTPDSGKNAKVL
jgi:hypothetical protein